MSIERIIKRHSKKHLTNKIDYKMTPGNDAGADSLRKAIDNYLLQRNKPVYKKLDGFHPSYHQGCPRWWFLMFRGVEFKPKIDSRLHRTFDTGHVMHERYYSYFREMGILVDHEVPIRIDEPVPIVGTADAIIDWGGLKLVELKSISPEGFQFRLHYRKPKDDHVLQAQVYLRALKLDSGYVIYEEKGSQNLAVFDIERDDDLYEKRVKRWEGIYRYVKEDKLPARPYERDSKHCRSCELESVCWDELPDVEGS